ncbi:ABC transporter permease [Thalassovita sp.]|uniref:ABC transporter permease n=1 Tax=Thalassovita sp. TaxID=1979401 RepID=UPI0029DE79EF|nr:ABC transporter permease subunit [Thalassovita sp.]
MSSNDSTMTRSNAPLFNFGDLIKRDRFAGLAVILLIVAALQIASLFAPDYIAPPPLLIAEKLWTQIFPLWDEILITLVRLLVALVFAMVVGTLLGIVMGMLPGLRPYVRSLVVIDTGIPALSWMLIAVFWFKEPEIRIFFIMSVILIPFYALNVFDGIRALPKEWLEMCESFRPSRWQVLRFLILPHIVAYVFTTTRSVIGYATRMVIFAELIASAVGIGAQMGLAQANFDIAAVFAWTLLLVVLNILSQSVVALVEKRVLSYRPDVEVR